MVMRSLLPFSWTRTTPSEVRRDPFLMLQEQMNRLFDSFANFPSLQWPSDISPRIDVCETDKEIDIDADLPGVDEKDVEVTLSGDVLTISGERKDGREERGRNYYVSERTYGRFARSVTLPFDADPKDVTARFEKGVLHIAVQKPDRMVSKTTKIPVKTA